MGSSRALRYDGERAAGDRLGRDLELVATAQGGAPREDVVVAVPDLGQDVLGVLDGVALGEPVALVEDLARLVRRLLLMLEKMHTPAAYNFVVHTRPTAFHDAAAFHWWMEIFPRLTKLAGFEWGSGCLINPVSPEAAATHLRSVARQLAKADRLT